MLVTGSVLTAQLMTWTHKAFGGNLHIGSSSGGTDVFCSCQFPIFALVEMNTGLNGQYSRDSRTVVSSLCWG